MAGIAITRTDLTAEELRAASSKAPSIPAARRMLALALVLEGADRTRAARSCGMDRQTLRDWVHRYNAEGLAGLRDRKAPGRAAKLTPEQMQQLAALVEAGPDVDTDGVVRWRRVDLQGRIKELFGVEMHERTVGKHLAKLGFVRLSVRPQHPKADEAAQEAFKNFVARVAELLPETARGKPLEIWFQDEARVGQQGTLTRVWARKGTRPRAPRDQRYKWTYLFGAACPARGTSAALVLPTVNTATMSLHLAEISRQVAPGAHAILVLDGAGYHGTAKKPRPRGLVVPDNITLLHLPASSPELNPIELVWQYLRQNKLAHRVYRTYQQIVDACCDAWNFFANDPDLVTSITARDWAQVKL